MNNTSEIFSESKKSEVLFGHSTEIISAKEADRGESNEWLKLIAEEGVIFFALMLIILFVLIYNRPHIFSFVLIALNIVILFWTPLFWLLIFLQYPKNNFYENFSN